MVFKLSRISRDVRRILDENRTTELLLQNADPETLDLEEQIKHCVEEAAETVIKAAPARLLDGVRCLLPQEISLLGSTRGYIVLPADFLRLLKVKLSCWDRPIYEASEEDGFSHRTMGLKSAGLQGTKMAPRAAIVSRGEGLTLELQGGGIGTATMEEGLYIRRPRLDRNDGIELPEGCYRAICLQTASLVALSYGRGNAESLTQRAAELLK